MTITSQDSPTTNNRRFGMLALMIASTAMLLALLSLVRSCTTDDEAQSQGNISQK
jgi:hypothetical protein